jgi:hypothetical protein
MLFTLITTMVLLLALMMAWIEVQRMARQVAEQHPEAGPLRLVGGGCGGQGHGEESLGQTSLGDKARATGPQTYEPAPAPEGCAACANTACKPGALMAAGAGTPDRPCAEPHPLLSH